MPFKFSLTNVLGVIGGVKLIPTSSKNRKKHIKLFAKAFGQNYPLTHLEESLNLNVTFKGVSNTEKLNNSETARIDRLIKIIDGHDAIDDIDISWFSTKQIIEKSIDKDCKHFPM